MAGQPKGNLICCEILGLHRTMYIHQHASPGPVPSTFLRGMSAQLRPLAKHELLLNGVA